MSLRPPEELMPEATDDCPECLADATGRRADPGLGAVDPPGFKLCLQRPVST